MKKQMFILTRNTQIITDSEDPVVLRSIKRMYRDMDFVLHKTDGKESTIRLIPDFTIEDEAYLIDFSSQTHMQIKAKDGLGFTYGLLFISEYFMKILPFWFWNDQKFQQTDQIQIPIQPYQSANDPVRFRGWFINDEVLIDHWKVNGDSDYPWEMVFEALLRCGGNVTIPGTDKNSIRYRRLASDMGLWISQHHAEPLGAEMFSRAFPELTPSFEEHPKRFRQLWKEAVLRQKEMKVIWNLGFRGQGDCPFWVNDPRYDSDEKRGELLSKLIEEQYLLVKSEQANAKCCFNLYGEAMELYRDGWLKLPEDVIKVWADNGYGKMVSRRQDLHNPRVISEPIKGMDQQGIYYHVSFYDLQGANHITLATNSPELFKNELENVLKNDGRTYWMINASNIKPHTYYLDFIARLWRDSAIDIEKHRMDYVEKYYGRPAVESVMTCLDQYFQMAIPFGSHEDEHMGEQYINHNTRILASQWWQGKQEAAQAFSWATNADTLTDQIAFYKQVVKKGVDNYGQFETLCEQHKVKLEPYAQRLFEDTIKLHGHIYAKCFQGAWHFCRAYEHFEEKEFQEAFYKLGIAAEFYSKAYQHLKACEHDQWIGFYDNECLTDLRQTVWILKELMGYVRNIGDGPHFYKWKRDFMYSEQDRHVMLILVHENHIQNDDLYKLMKARGGFTC